MIRRVSVSLFFMCFWIAVQAQEQKISALTYAEAVKIGLQNNLTLNQQKNALHARHAQKTQSVAAFLPAVTAFGRAAHTDGKQPNPETGDLADLSLDNVNASIQATLTVFNGLNSVNTLSQNANQFKAQTSFVKRSEQEVIFNVTNQYLLVLLDQELLRIADENFRAQNVLLDQLREQVRLGARAEADLYTQDALVRNFELTALRAKVALENDKALLAQILQLDPAISFAVQPPSLPSSFNLDNVSIDSLYAIALANREDLKQADYLAKANLSTYRASINGYMPTVTLFAQYGSSYNSNLKDVPAYGTFNNQFTTVFPTTAYGVNVTIPIFDRLATRTNRVLNRVTYDNAVLQRDNIEKTIKIDVRRTYNNYLAAVQSYEASQVQYQAGELALRVQQESFNLGVASQVVLAQANQIFVQAAASRAQAEVTLLFQKILMDYALGTLKAEDLQ